MCIHPFLPAGVNAFIKRSGLLDSMALDELLSDHTPFSFHSKFLNRAQRAKLKSSILFDANACPIKPTGGGRPGFDSVQFALKKILKTWEKLTGE